MDTEDEEGQVKCSKVTSFDYYFIDEEPDSCPFYVHKYTT